MGPLTFLFDEDLQEAHDCFVLSCTSSSTSVLPSEPPFTIFTLVWSQWRKFCFVLFQKWGTTRQIEYAGFLKYTSYDWNALLDLGFSVLVFASTRVWRSLDNTTSLLTANQQEGQARGNATYLPREVHLSPWGLCQEPPVILTDLHPCVWSSFYAQDSDIHTVRTS